LKTYGALVIAAALTSAPARAEDPPGSPAPPPLRHANPGFGLGLAQLGALGSPPRQRLGLQLDVRSGTPLADAVQFNFTFSLGVTRPENTVAMAVWGYHAGEAITAGYGDVADWVRGHPGGKEFKGLRVAGAFFAWSGLTMAYIVVPTAWILSPFAAVGHMSLGPTLSLHSGPAIPNGYFEAGFGGMVYGDPIDDAPGAAIGPMIGAGAQVGEQSVSVRLLASPPGLHASRDDSYTVVSGALVVGF
jgi:hypothetical protein